MSGPSIDVAKLINDGPVTGLQKLVILLCGCVVFLDGLDAQAIGYVAPTLSKLWHVKPAQLGLVLSAGLIGLMLGALIVAPLADRFGRRPLIIVSTMVFGVFTLATVYASDVQSLLILRLFTGFGLGGAMPNAIALTSEYIPLRRRSLLVVVMFSGFTMGSLFGGMVAAQALPVYGWQSVFLVGGALPIMLGGVLLVLLPESIRYLVISGASPRRTAQLRRRLDPSAPIPAHAELVVEQQTGARMSVRRLFSHGRAKSTLLLWLIFFMSLLDVYMLVNWLPTTMNAVGASVKAAVELGVLLQLGSLLGGVLVGWMLDRFGGRPAVTLAPAYALGAVCIAMIGMAANISIPLTGLAVFGAGFGVIGGQTAANAVASSAYPTELRSTGVGWALGIGRLGSILGPLLAGFLIQAHVSIRDVFLLSALPALCAIPAAIALGRTPQAETPSSPRDAIRPPHAPKVAQSIR